MKQKCIIILSEKSSGSTVVQDLIAATAEVKYAALTRHRENETLYWTKAASVLGLPQINMVASEVPIPMDRAQRELCQFLSDNLDTEIETIDGRQSLFDHWADLNHHYGPVFVEKSPHHLLQKNALKLMSECAEYLDSIDFYVVGLIRNPMDVIYSQFQRWGSSPQKIDAQWLQAYQNFELCRQLFGDRFKVFRYEDLCASANSVDALVDFLGLGKSESLTTRSVLDKPSLAKWKYDRYFGYQLSAESRRLSEAYGYSHNETAGRQRSLWPLYKVGYGGYKSLRILVRDRLVRMGLKTF